MDGLKEGAMVDSKSFNQNVQETKEKVPEYIKSVRVIRTSVGSAYKCN